MDEANGSAVDGHGESASADIASIEEDQHDALHLLSHTGTFGGAAMRIITTHMPALLLAVFKLTAERDGARDRVRRITATERVLTCVYCGEAYPPGSPTHGSEVLTAHIKTCAKHPMHDAEAKLTAAKAELASIGARVDWLEKVHRRGIEPTAVTDSRAPLPYHDELVALWRDEAVAALDAAGCTDHADALRMARGDAQIADACRMVLRGNVVIPADAVDHVTKLWGGVRGWAVPEAEIVIAERWRVAEAMTTNRPWHWSSSVMAPAKARCWVRIASAVACRAGIPPPPRQCFGMKAHGGGTYPGHDATQQPTATPRQDRLLRVAPTRRDHSRKDRHCKGCRVGRASQGWRRVLRTGHLQRDRHGCDSRPRAGQGRVGDVTDDWQNRRMQEWILEHPLTALAAKHATAPGAGSQ